MATKGRSSPRVVCCAIPIIKETGQIVVITSRTRKGLWVLPKGGLEPTDESLRAAALREAFEEAGLRGEITRDLGQTNTDAATFHFFELNVTKLESNWEEMHQRVRELVSYHEALRRVSHKPELALGLSRSSLAPKR